MSDIKAEVIEAATRSKAAAATLRMLTRKQKDFALNAIADALVANESSILDANRIDVDDAIKRGTDAAIIDRLTLNSERLAAIASAARDVCALPDPVGDVIRGYTLPNGLEISQVRVPLGVVAMVYEARPNVTVDAAVLCLKSGNAALLRGSSSAHHTNVALADVMRQALASTDVPVDAIVLVPGTSHESVEVVMTARGLVDVIIPRGGAGLINSVVNGSTVPVIETGIGNCHVYVDAAADIEKAVAIAVNSKTHRVSVCNAAETLLVHKDIAAKFLPALLSEYKKLGVTVHANPALVGFCKSAGVSYEAVTDADWAAEYYSLDIAAGIVDSIDDAIHHIQKWSTGHTEAIVSQDVEATRRFVAAIDSAAVMVNASTRFTDGGEFGFGAEIGISTQKLHARGPMGLPELTSYKYIVTGDGQIR
ncbi:MAG: gamma-glutamyl phosphate reductase [Actinomycetota bacterium]|jgi:glutamate-5-semialdehyde dehydrogenase